MPPPTSLAKVKFKAIRALCESENVRIKSSFNNAELMKKPRIYTLKNRGFMRGFKHYKVGFLI